MKGFYTLAEARVLYEAQRAAMSDEERTYHDNNQLVDRIAYALRSFEGSLDLEDGSFVDPVQAAHNLQAYLSMWGLFIGYAPRVD